MFPPMPALMPGALLERAAEEIAVAAVPFVIGGLVALAVSSWCLRQLAPGGRWAVWR